MKEHLQAAQDMMDGKYTNGWVNSDGMALYLRRGFHLIGGNITKCLDIANVLVDRPSKGTFTKFLDSAEALVSKHTKVHYVFVENIMNPRLAAFLRKRGYTQQEVGGLHGYFPNMYKYFGTDA